MYCARWRQTIYVHECDKLFDSAMTINKSFECIQRVISVGNDSLPSWKIVFEDGKLQLVAWIYSTLPVSRSVPCLYVISAMPLSYIDRSVQPWSSGMSLGSHNVRFVRKNGTKSIKTSFFPRSPAHYRVREEHRINVYHWSFCDSLALTRRT